MIKFELKILMQPCCVFELITVAIQNVNHVLCNSCPSQDGLICLMFIFIFILFANEFLPVELLCIDDHVTHLSCSL